MLTDPIADMLARIRNALMAGHQTVDIPASKIKKAIAEILKEEGYIKDYIVVDDKKQGLITIYLKYIGHKNPAIKGMKRVSKPGRRVYCSKDEIPKVLNGLGISILSTSRGVMTGKKAAQLGVGGEIVCYVW